MPVNILNLATYTVTAVEDNDHDYHINAEAKIAPKGCPHCQSNHLVGFGRHEQMVRDLPCMVNGLVFISIRNVSNVDHVLRPFMSYFQTLIKNG